MTEQTAPTEPEVEQAETEAEETTETESETTEEETEQEPETFPRDYVEKLRKESAGYREKAKGADDLARRLHTSLVAATGRLADPSDLEFSEDHLSDPEALTAAVDDLLERRPHLASRKVSGDVGQGASGGSSVVDLAGLLRSRAS